VKQDSIVISPHQLVKDIKEESKVTNLPLSVKQMAQLRCKGIAFIRFLWYTLYIKQ
jgi:hypothetical protein